MVAVADELGKSGDVARFKRTFAQVRLARWCRWSPRSWACINEIFYAVEDHYDDPTHRNERGGLDDGRLREIVGSQLPALRAEYKRLHAVEQGRPPDAGETWGDRRTVQSLHSLTRAFLAGELTAPEFDRDFRIERDGYFDRMTPDAQAAVESVRFALDALVPTGQQLRFHDLDEAGLRARLAEIEPRLAAVVDQSPQ